MDRLEFAVQEEALGRSPPAMLEGIAKALTRRLLHDDPGVGIREASGRYLCR
jgi:hypothetical protein